MSQGHFPRQPHAIIREAHWDGKKEIVLACFLLAWLRGWGELWMTAPVHQYHRRQFSGCSRVCCWWQTQLVQSYYPRSSKCIELLKKPLTVFTATKGGCFMYSYLLVMFYFLHLIFKYSINLLTHGRISLQDPLTSWVVHVNCMWTFQWPKRAFWDREVPGFVPPHRRALSTH